MARKKKPRIRANWWITDERVTTALGHEEPLCRGEDWHSIKSFWWGELGWDYEEGMKFRLIPTEENLKAMIKFVIKFYRDQKLSVTQEDLDASELQGVLEVDNCGEAAVPDELMTKLGLKQDEVHSWGWYLPLEALPITQRRVYLGEGWVRPVEGDDHLIKFKVDAQDEKQAAGFVKERLQEEGSTVLNDFTLEEVVGV